MSFKVFSRNGDILPIERAQVPVFNIEYSYGFGVYEIVRVIKNTIYFLEQHIERLLNSAQIIQLEHSFSKQKLLRNIKELTSCIQIKAYNLKILLIGARKKQDVLLYIFPLMPLFPDKKMYRRGVSLITVHYERPFPKAKTLNMLKSYLAYKKAKQNKCYDGLSIDSQNCIIEGTRTNFFLIKERTIFTAPFSKILDGVTMKIVLGLASKNGFSIKEKDFKMQDLAKYDGAFLTSTSAKVMPIKKIDNFIFSDLPIAIKELMKIYNDFLKKCNGKLDF